MFDIEIKKVGNGYSVKIAEDYHFDNDEEIFVYKTIDEVYADLPNVVARSEAMFAEAQVKKAAKETAKSV